MTPTWLHIDDPALSHRYVPSDPVDGTPEGLARCYKLGTPKDIDGDGILDEYILVRILFRREHMHAEIAVFPCDETGFLRGNSVMRRPGSFSIAPCPKGNEHAIAYATHLAFNMLDLELTAVPPEPEPEPEDDTPKLPEGLDYDPHALPDESWYKKSE